MNKLITTALTGAAVTMAVGTTAYMINSKTPARKRAKMKKTAVKAAHAMGDIVNGITSAIR